MSTRFPTRILQIAEEVADLGTKINNLLRGADVLTLPATLIGVAYETFDKSDSLHQVCIHFRSGCAEVFFNTEEVLIKLVHEVWHKGKKLTFTLKQKQIEDLRQGRLSLEDLVELGEDKPVTECIYFKMTHLTHGIFLDPLEAKALESVSVWEFLISQLPGMKLATGFPFQVSSLHAGYSAIVDLSFRGGLRVEVHVHYDMDEYHSYGEPCRQPRVLTTSIYFRRLYDGLPDLNLNKDWCKSESTDTTEQESLWEFLQTGTLHDGERTFEIVLDALRKSLGLPTSSE